MSFYDHVWMILNDLAPWLIFGLTVAGLLHVLLPEGFIRKHLGKKGWASVVKAVLIGVPAPLCSCSVIPAAIGIHKDGASNGASVGFLVSTPQTGVDSIAVSASFLGLPFALFKVAAAFVTGILGGFLTDVVVQDEDTANGQATPGCTEPPPPKKLGEKVLEVWRYGFDDLLYMIWKWILVGVLASAAISRWVPQDAFAGKVWATGLLGMLVVLAISTPLYVCATSSVPIAAALVQAGMPTGAALVFLMAGPATNVATIGAVYKAFGGKVLGIYLAVVMGGSVAAGYVFDAVLGAPGALQHTGHEHGPTWWSVAASILLVVLLARYAWQDLQRWWQARKQAGAGGDESLELTVQGMTCNGCVNRVQTALSAQSGVSKVEVDLESGRAVVRGEKLGELDLAGVIRKLGFQVAD